VESAEVDGPGELARVLLAHEVSLALLVDEARGLAVGTHDELPMPRVDLEAGELAGFGPTQTMQLVGPINDIKAGVKKIRSVHYATCS